MMQNYNKVLYIFGLGGHAKVILSEILLLGTYQEIIFIAPNNYSEVTIKINNCIYKVINNINDLHLLDNYKFDYIFHQAAISDTRVNDQEIVIQTNVNSFHYFLEIAKKDKATIIYASSASTYGSLPSPQKIGKYVCKD